MAYKKIIKKVKSLLKPGKIQPRKRMAMSGVKRKSNKKTKKKKY